MEFEPQDFVELDVIAATPGIHEDIAQLANNKLKQLLKQAPEATGTEIDGRWVFSDKDKPSPICTHRCRLVGIEKFKEVVGDV